jgi:hypothetical protein
MKKREVKTFFWNLFLDIEKTRIGICDESEFKNYNLKDRLVKILGLDFEGTKQVFKTFKITIEELPYYPIGNSTQKILEIAKRLNLSINELGGNIIGFSFDNTSNNRYLVFSCINGNIGFDLSSIDKNEQIKSGNIQKELPTLEEEIEFMKETMIKYGFELEYYQNPLKSFQDINTALNQLINEFVDLGINDLNQEETTKLLEITTKLKNLCVKIETIQKEILNRRNISSIVNILAEKIDSLTEYLNDNYIEEEHKDQEEFAKIEKIKGLITKLFEITEIKNYYFPH